jgi:rsbT antagonist protein RsbS
MIEFDYDFKTSVTVVQGCLIVTLPNEITDEEIELGISRLITEANNVSIVGAILDLSMLKALDSYTFTFLRKASKAISLMGVKVVWIGLRPGVVSALLDLNIDISGIKAAVNLEQAFKLVAKDEFNKNRGAY